MADRDSDSQEHDVSLKDAMNAFKAQGELHAKLSQDISNLRQKVHGASASVASQVKKMKTESQYKWKYEGKKSQFLLNSELLEELTQSIWAFDNSKVEYARETITEVIEKIKKKHNKPIKIASLVGKIVSMSYVIGSVAYIMTKHLCIGILEKTSWNSCIVLTDSRLNHIKFWKDSLPEVNGNQFTSDLSGQSIVYIDASNTGYGGYIVETSTNIAHDMWSECE